MITKEKFIQDMKSILNNIDCSETNGYISAESHWYAEMVIEQLLEDVDTCIQSIELHWDAL